jgi:hypothetical protein
VWALAERPPELAAEMGGRKPGGPSQIGNRERLEVPGVGEILRSQQVAGGRHHRDQHSSLSRGIAGRSSGKVSRWRAMPPPGTAATEAADHLRHDRVGRSWPSTMPHHNAGTTLRRLDEFMSLI